MKHEYLEDREMWFLGFLVPPVTWLTFEIDEIHQGRRSIHFLLMELIGVSHRLLGNTIV